MVYVEISERESLSVLTIHDIMQYTNTQIVQLLYMYSTYYFNRKCTFM